MRKLNLEKFSHAIFRKFSFFSWLNLFVKFKENKGKFDYKIQGTINAAESSGNTFRRSKS